MSSALTNKCNFQGFTLIGQALFGLEWLHLCI